MNEKPLERLNYYNGQRLEASDFKTEQDYHIRTRRWLNKSLYSAGIARGLEVRAVPPDTTKEEPPRVAVSPGLAIDNEGREIILLENATVEVCSFVGSSESTVEGNYLVIEYAEETIAYEKGGCAVRTEGTSANKSTTNWGGPSRIQAQVKFSWVPFVPHPGSNQIVLAQVELKTGCSEVNQIDPGARRYIGAASAATVRQYALEGEREVAFIPKELFPTVPATGVQPDDVDVVGRIYFHVRGRQPNSVTLHLRSELFSQTHYSELGGHTHLAKITGAIADHKITRSNLEHSHSLEGIITDVEKDDDIFNDGKTNFLPHAHYLWGRTGNLGTAVTAGDHKGFGIANTNGPKQVIGNKSGNDDPDVEIRWGRHRHRLRTETETPGPPETQQWPDSNFTDLSLAHSVSGVGSTISAFGISAAHDGAPITYVNDLQISLGQVGNLVNRTSDIANQLGDSNPANWLDGTRKPKMLGDGTGNHVFVVAGTGAIRLDFLPGMSFAEGEYCIELRVDAKTESGKRVANGGKIHYNLYIE